MYPVKVYSFSDIFCMQNIKKKKEGKVIPVPVWHLQGD